MNNIGAHLSYCVYIMTNKTHTALYTGVTSDIVNRCEEHRQKKYPNSFTSKYNINKLVWFEFHNDINSAIAREKQIKAGNRNGKIKMIEAANPAWDDLAETQLKG